MLKSKMATATYSMCICKACQLDNLDKKGNVSDILMHAQ